MKLRKYKIYQIGLILFFCVTLLLFGLEVIFHFGNPLFVIGLDFFIGGLLLVPFATVGYLFLMFGAFLLSVVTRILIIDMYYFRYVVVFFFPFVPFFILFSEWNDKQRIVRKGGEMIDATCQGFGSAGYPIFSYSFHGKKYKGPSYKNGEDRYKKGDKVSIIVDINHPKKFFAPLPMRNIIMLRRITLFLTLFALISCAIMFFG